MVEKQNYLSAEVADSSNRVYSTHLSNSIPHAHSSWQIWKGIANSDETLDFS